jgi:tryptophan synthase alpha subunit
MVSSECYRITNRFWKRTRRLFQTYCRHESKNPQVIGFGINNKETFEQATQFAKVLLLVVLLFRI